MARASNASTRFRPLVEVLERRLVPSNNPVEGHTWKGVVAAFSFNNQVSPPTPTAYVRATIHWGDGKPDTTVNVARDKHAGPPVWQVIAKHVFDHWGQYSVTVHARDVTDNRTADAAPVFNAAMAKLTLNAAQIVTTVGQSNPVIVATGKYDRPQYKPKPTDRDLAYVVYWGPAPTDESTGVVQVGADGKFTIRAGHAYAARGSYPVTIDLGYLKYKDPSGDRFGPAPSKTARANAVCPLEEDELRDIVGPGLSDATLKVYTAALNRAMSEYGIGTPAQRAAFLAEIAEETAGLTNLTEEGGPKYFRATYGKDATIIPPKTTSVDQWYIGRGMIQLTHDYNYHGASESLFGPGDHRLVDDPTLVVSNPDIAARSAGWFWSTHFYAGTSLNDLAEDPSAETFRRTSLAINGHPPGSKYPRGWADRLERYQHALEAIYLCVNPGEQLTGIGLHDGKPAYNITDAATLKSSNTQGRMKAVDQTADALGNYLPGSTVTIWVSHYDTALKKNVTTHRTTMVGCDC